MILLISTCKEKFHENEFVNPVKNAIGDSHGVVEVQHYSEVTEGSLVIATHVIICGTSLQDHEFLDHVNKFEWLKEYNKPVLGICAGMQIIGKVFGGELKEKKEIGYYNENFTKDFFGLTGEHQIYHLHNNYVEFTDEFIEFTDSEIPQAVKHKEKEIYGCLFHPEVREKPIIEKFAFS